MPSFRARWKRYVLYASKPVGSVSRTLLIGWAGAAADAWGNVAATAAIRAVFAPVTAVTASHLSDGLRWQSCNQGLEGQDERPSKLATGTPKLNKPPKKRRDLWTNHRRAHPNTLPREFNGVAGSDRRLDGEGRKSGSGLQHNRLAFNPNSGAHLDYLAQSLRPNFYNLTGKQARPDQPRGGLISTHTLNFIYDAL
jgi:hypothetical protein